ncbi:MAG: hypothetical protein CMJ31_10220 [Phycisphaerae bacterium]|nr:hypothetical protein [Phycisphaerae bacterium]
MDELPAKRKGEVIEGYRILSEIGRGAASVIYLAQDQRSKQVVALKHVEKRDAKDQRFLDQAEMEYKVASRLDDPRLRKIFKLFKKGPLLKVRELYLVMELVDGISVDRHPPATFEAALDIFREVALGLAHMHAKGFVHADMKPNNIIISDDGTTKVIDLGQSCEIGTVKERIQGTPDYIAPEQVHCREITPKTDIYNLGATMYWVLTRTKVPTALSGGDSLVGRRDDHLIEKAKPASEINTRIPDRLNTLIMMCIEVDPLRRPASMDAVAESLGFVLEQLRSKNRAAAPDPDDDDEQTDIMSVGDR